MKRVSVNADLNAVFLIINNAGMINAGVNVKNLLIKGCDKGLGILVILSVNVVNHAILENI